MTSRRQISVTSVTLVHCMLWDWCLEKVFRFALHCNCKAEKSSSLKWVKLSEMVLKTWSIYNYLINWLVEKWTPILTVFSMTQTVHRLLSLFTYTDAFYKWDILRPALLYQNQHQNNNNRFSTSIIIKTIESLQKDVSKQQEIKYKTHNIIFLFTVAVLKISVTWNTQWGPRDKPYHIQSSSHMFHITLLIQLSLTVAKFFVRNLALSFSYHLFLK